MVVKRGGASSYLDQVAVAQWMAGSVLVLLGLLALIIGVVGNIHSITMFGIYIQMGGGSLLLVGTGMAILSGIMSVPRDAD